MLNIKFIPDSGFDFWYDHREKLQDVCIFPELRIDNLPERGHKILHQRITRLSDHFYFHQCEEYHDHWRDSDDQTIVQLPDSIPAGWTADQPIDWLIESSDRGIASADVDHLRRNRHLIHFLHQPQDADLFLEAPGIGGIFAFSGRDYKEKHPYTLDDADLEISIGIAAEVLCPEQAASLQKLFDIFSDESLEMMQFTEEFSHQAMPSEMEVLDAETAFIYFTGTHPGHPRRCVMAVACPISHGWSYDLLD